MLTIEKITKPIQIIQYYGDDDILLEPDYVASVNLDITETTLELHNNAVVLLTAQDDDTENGMYKYTGTSLVPYFFSFFRSVKKIYKVTSDSTYLIYNGPTDSFNQFYTISKNDTIIIINDSAASLPYEWYSYNKLFDPKIRFNKEIIINNFCALGTLFNDKTDEIILNLNNSPSYPIVLTSEAYNGLYGEVYHVITDIVKSPDIDYRNIFQYDLEEGTDFTTDGEGNLILDQQLIIDGLSGIGKLSNWRLISSTDPNFLNNNFFLIKSQNQTKLYFYNTELINPYGELSQDIVKYPFSLEVNFSNIIYEKRNLIQNNITTISGMPTSTYINSSFYIQKMGAYELRTRLYNNNLALLSEDRIAFNVKQLLNLPTPTPTPTPSSRKHSVVFDAGPRLVVENCEDCYKDFLFATVTNMSQESRYYYEFGVYEYGNPNPDEPRDDKNSDDISFVTNSGIINNGTTTEKISTLMTTGIGKIRTTLYIKVINLDNYITSTSYLTLEKCNRDFCATTPTPTASKALKSYPPRTPTKTKTPTPTKTSTSTPTPTPTPTTPLNPPAEPTNLLAVPNNASVSLSWTAPLSSIVRDYIIQYSFDLGVSWVTFNDGVNTNTFATVTGLTNGVSYLFRVAATNGAGASPYAITGTPVSPVASVPFAPVVSAVTAGDSQATISWTIPNNGGATITDYIIEYSNNVGGSWTSVTRPPSTATSATITGLINGSAYIFRVAAINSTGTGGYSINSASVTPATVPGAPTSVLSVLSGANINLSWTPPIDNGGAAITDYTIMYSSNNGTNWTTFSDGTSSNTTSLITGLALGSTYIFRVAATNRTGTGPFSSNSNPIFFALAPATPTNIQAISTNNTIQLSWSTPSANGSPIIDFTIQTSSNNGVSWTTVSSNTTSNIITISSPTVELGFSYTFRVAARNSIALGPYVISSQVTLYPQGQLLSWGSNSSSQLGDGLYQARTSPRVLTKQWSKINVYNYDPNNYSALAIDTSGELYGWGFNSNGVIGNGSTTATYTPQRIGTNSNWTVIALGYDAAYAINSSGELYAWGSNTYGQLGVGGLESGVGSYSYTPIRIGTESNWTKVVAGERWAAAINSNGELYTWGINSNGNLGTGSTTGGSMRNRIGATLSWSDIGAGWGHLVAITSTGEMYSCGNNSNGQLGDNTTTNKLSLIRIGSLSNWSKVECGYNHNLAINTQNQLYAWGHNIHGQLGIGTTTRALVPTQVGSSSNWNSNLFAAGYHHSMAVNNLGEVYSWGYNAQGQLGDGTTTSKTVTSRITSLVNTNINSISLGFYGSWIVNSGNLMFAGYTPYTGNGGSVFNFTTLGTSVSATLANNYTQVSAGSSFTAASNNIGQLYVWGGIANNNGYANSVFTASNINNIVNIDANDGQNSYLALDSVGGLRIGGAGTYHPYNTSPGLYSLASVNHGRGPINKIAAGYFHSFIIDNTGKLYGAGHNLFGAVGVGTTSVTAYTQIGTASNWTEVAAGNYISAAINNLGELYTWGNNNIGQLGLADTTIRSTPTRVGVLSNWVKLAVGGDFMLAINTLGEIWSWGSNTNGQLGIGSVPYTFVPTKVGTATNWVSISAGNSHTLAINSAKQLWAWGANQSGQLGDGTNTSRNTPVRIGSSYTWLSVSAGSNHSIGIIQS